MNVKKRLQYLPSKILCIHTTLTVLCANDVGNMNCDRYA